MNLIHTTLYSLGSILLLLLVGSFLALPQMSYGQTPSSTTTVAVSMTKAISGDNQGFALSDFSYHVSGNGIDQVVPHSQSVDLPVGTYTIEELVPAGFVKDDWRIGWWGACENESDYDTTITIDDGNVDHGFLDCHADNQYRPDQPQIEGCTDPDAENYDPAADVDDGSCTYDNGGGNGETYLIEGYVWHDLDKDGVIDEDEDRLEDWEVLLTSGTSTSTTTSDSDGYYSFVVTAGSYTLREVVMEDWEQVFPTPTSYNITVPETVAQLPFPLNWLIKTAQAQTPVTSGPFNFGNVLSSNGGGGNGGFDCSLNASDTSVSSGAKVTLSWDATGASYAALNQGIGTTTAVGTTSVTVNSDTTYTLTANDGQSTTTCSVAIDVGNGGDDDDDDDNPGGGSSGVFCRYLHLSSSDYTRGASYDLTWVTRRGSSMSITANGTEIFATTTNDTVDTGTTTVVANEPTTYELTVMRGSRDDTCSVTLGNRSSGGGGGSSSGGGTPRVLGEQVNAVPLGAPDTGFVGGITWTAWAALATFLGLVLTGTGVWYRRRFATVTR